MDNIEVPDSNVKESVINKLNEELGKDLLKLHVCNDTRKRLEDEKEKIQQSLSLTGNEFPSTISTASKHVEEVLEKISNLSKQHDKLNKSVNVYQEKVDRVKVKAETYINKIDDLEKTFDYLKIIKEVEDVSNTIEAAINDKNDKKQIMNYLTLCHICTTLTDSKCVHLYTFVNETMHYWHNILKDRFTSEYDEILKAIKWPFVGNSVLVMPSTETMNTFQILTENLLQIQLDSKALTTSLVVTDFPPLSLPMTQLIKPLRKRFVYHFMGSRQTNRADKPEWFFTQVLTWIRDHQDFVEKNIQPLYDKIGKKNVIAKIELMRGLVQIVVEKLHFELPHLHYDDSLFSHCVDEALGFDKELKTSFGYPSTEPGVIEVLTQAQIFVKWINMEKRFNLEKMDRILGSETAFDTLVSGDVDENHVTECADGFLTLLSTITERYEMLPQPGHRLQFLQLQLDLIDDFRVRLLQMLREENLDPLNSKFPNILNTVNYVRNVLEEWSVNTLFLHLHYYKSKLDGNVDPTASVFEEYIHILGKMRDDLIEDLIDNVFMDVKAKSMPYRKDKWHAMDSPKNLIKPVISPSACPMFQVLITRLHQLQELLAASLFKQAWTSLAKKLDEYLYEEMVAICLFNEGGASQFNYDITKNLFPLFGQYYNKPEVHFKYLKDSCVLLSMPQGLALSLQEAITKKCDNQYDVSEILADVGVFTLQRDAVLELLSRRTDLN